jgi:hypothetical protein
MKAKHRLMNKLHWFTGPITPSCDWYIQYLLTGANSLVLNRHRWELQPWRCRLSTYHSLTFPTSGLHFSPKGLPGLKLIISIKPLPIKSKSPRRQVTSMPLDLYQTQQLCLAITNDLSLAIGITRIDRKQILMQLGHQSNSYDLMHKQESQPRRFKDKQNLRIVVRCTGACLDLKLS